MNTLSPDCRRPGFSARVLSAVLLLSGLTGIVAGQDELGGKPPSRPAAIQPGFGPSTAAPATAAGPFAPAQPDALGRLPASGASALGDPARNNIGTSTLKNPTGVERGTASIAGEPADRKTETDVRIYQPRNVPAAEVAELIRRLFDLNPQVISGNVVVIATPQQNTEIQELLARLDVAGTATVAPAPKSDVFGSAIPGGEGSFATGGLSVVDPVVSVDALRHAYTTAEREAASLRSQLMESARPIPRDNPLLRQLRMTVARAFAARQALLKAELNELRQRMNRLEQAIASRERIADKIIDRRVEDLLNPDLNWGQPPTATGDEARFGGGVTFEGPATMPGSGGPGPGVMPGTAAPGRQVDSLIPVAIPRFKAPAGPGFGALPAVQPRSPGFEVPMVGGGGGMLDQAEQLPGPLEGTWSAIEAEVGGARQTAVELAAGTQLTINRNRFALTSTVGGQGLQGTFQIGRGADPKGIELHVQLPNVPGIQTMPGTCELIGDTLRLSFGDAHSALIFPSISAPPDQKRAIVFHRITSTFPSATTLRLLCTAKGKPIESAIVDVFRQTFQPGDARPRVERYGLVQTDASGHCEISLQGEAWKQEPRSGFLLYVTGAPRKVKCIVVNGDSRISGPISLEFNSDVETAPHVPPQHLAIASRKGVTLTPSRDNVEGFAFKEEGDSEYSTPVKTLIQH